jgi:AraC family transcriptional regulator, alkane utilization regulator
MVETPQSFAATPDVDRGGDVLAEMLRSIRLSGSVFLSASLTEPFGLISPRHFDERTPMAHLRHVSIFHLISAGECTVELASGQRETIRAGDILLMPFADAHTFSSGEGGELSSAMDLVRAGPLSGMWNITHGGGGQETRMVCGFIESSELLYSPVFRTLPPLLIDRTGDDKVSALLTTTVREILTLTSDATPGSEIMLGRLMELLFVEVLRRYAASLPESAQGWLAALNDPLLGRAMRQVHGNPGRRWTVDDLAREAGTSRTVLAERFNEVLGQAPIEYVTSWRMQLAAERMRTGTDNLAVIANDVGYDSEAAFNRAFKRVTGIAPGRWRDGARSAPPYPTPMRRDSSSG